MALHGDIRVNNQKIGEWAAQRTTDIATRPYDDDVNTYKCFVAVHDKVRSFEVQHRYGDGPEALAAKVLGADCD